MRIGTWNLAGRWTPAHAELIAAQRCDVWLLTEVSHRLHLGAVVVHRSTLDIARKRSFAAVVAGDLVPQPDPHGGSAAARIEGMYFCSSVLPWRSCGDRAPWTGARHADKTAAAVADLEAAFPNGPLVWGGDWNHALSGRETAGSQEGRGHVTALLDVRAMQVPTAPLGHRLDGCLSIDHVAVPSTWTALGAQVPAEGLSDHDAYVVEVTVR